MKLKIILDLGNLEIFLKRKQRMKKILHNFANLAQIC